MILFRSELKKLFTCEWKTVVFLAGVSVMMLTFLTTEFRIDSFCDYILNFLHYAVDFYFIRLFLCLNVKTFLSLTWLLNDCPPKVKMNQCFAPVIVFLYC